MGAPPRGAPCARCPAEVAQEHRLAHVLLLVGGDGDGGDAAAEAEAEEGVPG
jgi:hypothetical protein